MALDYLSLRSSITTTTSIRTLSTTTLSVAASTLALGLSTTQSQTNFSNGSYAPASWQATKTGLANVKKLATSSTGQYQLIVSDATSSLFLSSDSGVTWTALGATQGLPVPTGSSCWVTGAISASGQTIMLALQGGSLWCSNDFGRTFSTTAQPTPDLWLQLNGDTTDSMGGPAATATGSPSYLSFPQPGFTEQAVSLVNVAGGNATQYIRGTGVGLDSAPLTASFWFNPQTLSPSSQAAIFMAKNDQFGVLINSLNQLVMYFPTSPSSWSYVNASYTVVANTWYYVTAIFQANGTCSLYVNNTLLGSGVNTGGVTAASNVFSLGTFVGQTASAFHGHIADFRLNNSALSYNPVSHQSPAYWLPMEGTVADSGSYALQNQAPPLIYCPLNGSLTDAQGGTTLTATGSITYVANTPKGIPGTQSVVLANTAGGTATNYLQGTWNVSPNFTLSFWVNPQSATGSQQNIVSAFGGSIVVNISSPNNYLSFQFPTGTGTTTTSIATSTAVVTGSWYFIQAIFQANGLCSFYVNNILVGTPYQNAGGFGTLAPNGVLRLGCTDNATTFAFNGYLDEFRIYNTAFVQTPHPTLRPTIYLPFEGTAADSQNASTITVTGAPTYLTSTYSGALGTQSINLSNTAGGTAANYLRGTWAGSPNFTVSLWVNPQSATSVQQNIFSAYNGNVLLYIDTSNRLVFQFPTGSNTTTTTLVRTGAISTSTWYYLQAIFQSNGTCSFYVNNSLVNFAINTGGFGSITSSNLFSLGCSDVATTQAFNGYIDEFRIYNNNLAQPVTPYAYLPLESNVNDSLGNSIITATGSPVFVTSAPSGVPGTQSINLANTAGSTAARYLTGSWTGSSSFTVSLWVNPQTLNGSGQRIFSAYFVGITIEISTSNLLTLAIASGSGYNRNSYSLSSALSTNTWYYVTFIFQSNSLCSFYVNNSLVASFIHLGFGSYGSSGTFRLGGSDSDAALAFNGYIDEFRLYNSAVIPNPSLSVTPLIHLPFEGTVADVQGSSAVTATGAPAYVTTVRTGATGIRAINLANTLGAGINATQYVRGTWTNPPSWTVSFWFNMQSFSGVQGQSALFSTNYANTIIMVYPTSLSVYALSGGSGGIRISTSSIPSTNTWHYVTYVHQDNGTCALYLNNALVGTYTNSGGLGSSSGVFSLGTYDASLITPFNGYIDDFRLYNAAIPYQPVSVVQAVGTISTVPGAVGGTAVSLANTAGGTATNYVRGAWTGASNFTVSGWFNTQSPVANQYQLIFCAYQGYIVIATDTSNRIYGNVISNDALVTLGPTSYSITQNTWYHFTLIFQTGGLCSFYINGTLVGSTTNTGGVGTRTTTAFALGTYDNATNFAFNGYIDDLRLYNSAIPYNSLSPMNISHLILSGNLAYQMAANSVGQLWLSSNSGSTWAAQDKAATPGAWSSLSASYSGKYLTAQSQPVVQPNQSGLATSTWSQQGVTYTVSASSAQAGHSAYQAFDSNTATVWSVIDTPTAPYSISTGLYQVGSGGSFSTTIQGIGAVAGEWLQLQTSVPLVLSSYRYTCNAMWRLPKNYYIVGSNDGTTWYPIQYCVIVSNPFTASYVTLSNTVLVNYTGTQQLLGNVTSSCSTTSYASSVSSYLYFRIVVSSIFSGGGDGGMEYAEFLPNFLGGCVMPNKSGLSAETWSNSGVGWRATASSTNGTGFESYRAFDNLNSGAVNSRWVSANLLYNSTTGAYLGSVSTPIQGVGTISGEWLQLQVSMQMVLQSYTLAVGASSGRMPKIYYIVGSTDGSTWYPLQLVSMTTSPFTVSYTTASTNLIMNYSGTQTIQGNQTGSGTTTAYAPYVTQAWTYFRMVVTTTYGGADQFLDIGEFYPIFTAGQTSSTTSGLTWTPTLQTGDAFNVTKNLTVTSAGTGFATLSSFRPVSTGLTISARITVLSIPVQGSRIFDASTTTSGQTNVLLAWLYADGAIFFQQMISGINAPTVISTTKCQIGIETHIVWTIDGSGNHRFYFNGTADAQTASGPINVITYPYFYIGKSTFSSADPYPNMTVRDFRMFNRALNAAEVSQLYNNVNYGQPALGPLTISDSGEYALAAHQTIAAVGSNYLANHQRSSYTNPILTGITNPICDTAVSQTGQYMVLVTAGTTNNVYYSRDFGATFTALTLGSSAMVSCSMSYDGTYLTATNAAGTVYRLNANSTGYTLALGNGAGQINQASNAIAIGNLAGQTNQSANSIVLNASGSAVNTGSAGFYVAPISGPSGLSMDLLGYGADKQVTTTGITVAPGAGAGTMYVGIGTTTPFYGTTLSIYNTTADCSRSADVNPLGHICLRNSKTIISPYSLEIGVDQGFGIGYLNAAGNSTYQPVCLNTRGGNVGIGTTNPTTNLHIRGTSGTGYFNNACLRLSSGITTAESVQNGTSIEFTNAFNSTTFTLMAYGYTGGATSGFYISNNSGVGVYLASGSNAWAAYSDRRMKTNIYPMSGSLTELMHLRPVTYLYEKDTESNYIFPYRVGFIADEVEVIYPHLVSRNAGTPYTNKQGETFEPSTVSMTDMIPYMIRSIQELKTQKDAEIAALQTTLADQSAQLAEKSSQLDALLTWAKAQGFSG